MPSLHDPDWSQLKISDFPQFQCLCELCDCGCYERSKKPHSQKCKKRVTQISNAFESNFEEKRPFDANTMYDNMYRTFAYDTPRNASLFSDPDVNRAELPAKPKPKTPNIILPKKSVKLSTETTTKAHYPFWRDGRPADPAPEYPALAGTHLYPGDKRHFTSTNKQLFRSHYGVHMAQPSGLNLLEPTHTFYDGKMTTDTSYRDFFDKGDFKDMFKDRGPMITREMMERRGQRMTGHIAFDHKTQTMMHFQHDPELFKSVVLDNMAANKKDMFASKLQNNMRPRKGFVDDSSSALKDENKNFKFITSFDGRMIPSLKAIKASKPKSRRGGTSHSVSSTSSTVSEDYNLPRITAYNDDFKERGVDICMAKAYAILAANKANTMIKSQLDNELFAN